VARLLIAGLRTLGRSGGFTTRREQVNGQPGALFFDRDGKLISVAILDIADGQVQGINAVANPDKLRHLGPVGDVRALLRG
jgi:RNA polymerase sigma-70 factor (ECF subfamily)